jgi:hypothetical protein
MSWGVRWRPVREADNIAVMRDPFLENVGFSTLHNPIGVTF